MGKRAELLGGPLAGVLVAVGLAFSQEYTVAVTAGVAVWMALWWMTEAVSIYFTAFLPAILFPLLGVISMRELAPAYFPQVLFFFIGGFLLAFGLEKWNLHKRIALGILRRVGGSPDRLLAGFMVSSFLLSMWILNTATVLMLLPAVLAVIGQFGLDAKTENRMAVPFLLGTAYSSSIGGTATLIGTAPNLYFMEFYNRTYPDATPMGFAHWMAFALPMTLIFMLVCFVVLRFRYRDVLQTTAISRDVIQREWEQLGRMGWEERCMAVVYGAAVFLWFFARDIELGSLTIPGWKRLLPQGSYVQESTIAMLAAGILFVLPARSKPGMRLLNWKDAERIPMGILFLFGGGFALAKAITVSGLDAYMGELVQGVTAAPPALLVASMATFTTFFTELTSNTASIALLLPLVNAVAEQVAIAPWIILLPVVVSASFAFMLPVATPPNTLVFGTGKISMRDMVRTGIILNLVGIVLAVLFAFFWAPVVFGN